MMIEGDQFHLQGVKMYKPFLGPGKNRFWASVLPCLAHRTGLKFIQSYSNIILHYCYIPTAVFSLEPYRSQIVIGYNYDRKDGRNIQLYKLLWQAFIIIRCTLKIQCCPCYFHKNYMYLKKNLNRKYFFAVSRNNYWTLVKIFLAC